MNDKPIFYGCYETEAETFKRQFWQVLAAYLWGSAITLFLVVAYIKL
jgi:hypothetical protein